MKCDVDGGTGAGRALRCAWAVVLLLVCWGVARPEGARAGGIVEYPIPTTGSQPEALTFGPDGAFWFTEYWAGQIGRVDTNGVFKEYIVPSVPSLPFDIVTGPDGNLWFTESYTNKIGRVTTNGTFQEFKIPTTNSIPTGITVGPDSNIWFLEIETNKIGRMDTNGSNIVEFTTNTFGTNILGLYHIISGPDGNLWFTESSVSRMGRITPTGTITEFPLPGTNCQPYDLVTGPDGAIWFSEYNSNKIGRITIDAIPGNMSYITEFPLPTNIDIVPVTNSPYGMLAGPDGNIWFTDFGGSSIGKMTTNGVVTRIFTPTTNSFPSRLAVGQGNDIWFGEVVGAFRAYTHNIARMVQPTLMITPGTNLLNVLLTWTTNAGTNYVLETNSDLTTTNWGFTTNVPVTVNGQLTVTNAISNTLFFRLISP